MEEYMTKEDKQKKKELKHWNQEVKLIPKMIEIYCHGNHHTKKGELCEKCQELKEYSLFRLSKCPFKVNKGFCSFCKIHCYQPQMREEIKKVMRYSGPRMTFSHPIFSFSHVSQMIKYKKSLKKEKEKND
jgi:putative cytoplasmic protein